MYSANDLYSNVLHKSYRILYIYIFTELLPVFRAFMVSEYSEENLDFWLEVEGFKKQRKYINTANKIFSKYIEVDAPREVLTCFS